MQSTPYATVVLPTFNRHSTLPFAIQSVLAQSEPDLELLIVLDGASEQCRKAAAHAASKDERVRILDLPKAPGNGEQNTDIAVRQASASRIFYIDDDDLFLPDHVTILGTLLDAADVADSRLCSIGRNGNLHLGISKGSNRKVRELLAEFKLKMLYDTHFAHRKSAYGKFGSWIPQDGTSSKPVWSMLAGFAADSKCVWASTEQITAINLHGACRRDMSDSSRVAEIQHWQSMAQNPHLLQQQIGTSSSGFNLLRLLRASPSSMNNLADYLRGHGAYPDTYNQENSNLYDLVAGIEVSEEIAIEIAMSFAEPVEATYWTIEVAEYLLSTYGIDRASKLLSAAIDRSGAPTGLIAAKSVVEMHRDVAFARQLAQSALELGPDPVDQLQNLVRLMDEKIDH